MDVQLVLIGVILSPARKQASMTSTNSVRFEHTRPTWSPGDAPAASSPRPMAWVRRSSSAHVTRWESSSNAGSSGSRLANSAIIEGLPTAGTLLVPAIHWAATIPFIADWISEAFSEMPGPV